MAVTLVQSQSALSAATVSISLASAPTSGNLLLYFSADSTSGNANNPPTGFTSGTLVSTTGGSQRSARIGWKVSAGTEQTVTGQSQTTHALYMEWSGVGSLDGTVGGTGENAVITASGTNTTPSITPTTGFAAVAFLFASSRSTVNFSSESITGTNAGAVTEDLDSSAANGSLAVAHALISSTSGAYQGTLTPATAAVGTRHIAIFKQAVAGTTNPKSLSASATPSADIVLASAKALSVSATSAASALRANAKSVSASVTSAGVALKQAARRYSATATSAAALVASKLFLKTLAASVSVNTGGQSLLDDFNRANGALGSNWGTWNIFSNTTDYTISSNAASGTSARNYWSSSTFAADQEGQVTLTTLGGLGCYFGLRIQNPTTYASMTGYVWFVSSSTGIRLFTASGGSLTTRYTDTGFLSFTDGDVLHATAVGNTHTLYRNGTQVAQVTDSTFNQSGYVGVGNASVFDDFNASALTASTPSVAKRIGKALSSSVTNTVSKALSIRTSKTASTTSGASVLRLNALFKTAGVTSTASFVRKIFKTLSASGTATAVLNAVKTAGAIVNPLTLTAAATATSTVTRFTAKAYAATATSSASVARVVRKGLAASSTATATVHRLMFRLVSASTTATATAVRRIFRTLNASVSTSAVLQSGRSYLRTLTASSTATATAPKIIFRLASASATATTTLAQIRHYFRTLAASVTASVSMHRTLILLRVASVTPVAVLQIGLSYLRTLTASVGTSSTLSRAITKRYTLTSSAFSTLARQISATRVATTSTTATVRRDFSTTLAASVEAIGDVFKQLPITLVTSVTALADWTWRLILSALPSKVILSDESPTVLLTDSSESVTLEEIRY